MELIARKRGEAEVVALFHPGKRLHFCDGAKLFMVHGVAEAVGNQRADGSVLLGGENTDFAEQVAIKTEGNVGLLGRSAFCFRGHVRAQFSMCSTDSCGARVFVQLRRYARGHRKLKPWRPNGGALYGRQASCKQPRSA